MNLRKCIAIYGQGDQLASQVIWSPPGNQACALWWLPAALWVTFGYIRTGFRSEPDTLTLRTGHQLALIYSIIIGLMHVLGSHNISSPVCPKSLIALDRLRIHGGVRARFTWVARRFALLASKWILTNTWGRQGVGRPSNEPATPQTLGNNCIPWV